MRAFFSLRVVIFHIWTPTFFALYIICGKFKSFPIIFIVHTSEADTNNIKLDCWAVEIS